MSTCEGRAGPHRSKRQAEIVAPLDGSIDSHAVDVGQAATSNERRKLLSFSTRLVPLFRQ